MKKSVGTNSLEEEPVIEVRFVKETSGMKMIVDIGVPYSISSTKQMDKYMEEGGVDKNGKKQQGPALVASS